MGSERPLLFDPQPGITDSDLWRCACLAPAARSRADLPADLQKHFAVPGAEESMALRFAPAPDITNEDIWRCACVAPGLRHRAELPADLRRHFTDARPPV